jgi:hypothetical protein
MKQLVLVVLISFSVFGFAFTGSNEYSNASGGVTTTSVTDPGGGGW